MKTCNMCTNPFPFVCNECAADVYQAMAEDAKDMGLSPSETQALALQGLSTSAPAPTGSFTPRDVVQQEQPEPVMQQFAKLFIGSGEDVTHCGC